MSNLDKELEDAVKAYANNPTEDNKNRVEIIEDELAIQRIYFRKNLSTAKRRKNEE